MQYPELKGMIQIREVDDVYYWLDAVSNHAICGRENHNPKGL